MTTTTEPKKTLAQIDFEVSHYEQLAKAEAALDAIGHAENPWRGSVDRLEALLLEREALGLMDYGNALSDAIARRAGLRADFARIDEQLRADQARFAELGQHDTVTRWKRAPAVAAAVPDLGRGWERYRDWLLSGRAPFQRTSNEYLPPNAPPALTFSEVERSVIKTWAALDVAIGGLQQVAQNTRGKVGEIEAQFPELRSVP